eukprot:764067-Hanusia_phi.AAC.2
MLRVSARSIHVPNNPPRRGWHRNQEFDSILVATALSAIRTAWAGTSSPHTPAAPARPSHAKERGCSRASRQPRPASRGTPPGTSGCRKPRNPRGRARQPSTGRTARARESPRAKPPAGRGGSPLQPTRAAAAAAATPFAAASHHPQSQACTGRGMRRQQTAPTARRRRPTPPCPTSHPRPHNAPPPTPTATPAPCSRCQTGQGSGAVGSTPATHS